MIPKILILASKMDGFLAFLAPKIEEKPKNDDFRLSQDMPKDQNIPPKNTIEFQLMLTNSTK